MRARVRHALLALIPVTLVAVVGAIGGELWLRAQHRELRATLDARFKDRERCTRASADPRLVYEGVPGKCDQNSNGFRDGEHALAKPPGTFRIVVIGDSVAAGQGVRPDETFARVLERVLRERGKDAEVIVLAVTGYSTVQQFPLLDRAYAYGPDLVLWAYTLNDPADPVLDNANGELGAYFHAPGSYVHDWLHTRFARATLNLKGRDCPQEWHARMHCLHREDIARNFATIAASGKARGTPIALVVLPLLPERGGYDAYAWRAIHDDLRALAAAQGLAVIDALPAFAGADVADLRLPGDGAWVDPWHPNARGHALLGSYLARQLGDREARQP